MRSLVIDLGRQFVRFGPVEGGKLLDGYRMPLPHRGISDLLRFLQEYTEVSIKDGILAVAAPGPFKDGVFRGLNMTGWEFQLDDLREFTERLIVVHDVIGGAFGAEINPQRELLNNLHAEADADLRRNPRAYIQTGVGLGAAALLPMPNGEWMPASGEAGSITLAPMTGEENMVFRHFNEHRGQWKYPTAQELLSTESIKAYAIALGGDYRDLDCREIFSRAREGDLECQRATAVYAGFLGSFAASIALSYRAYDGLTVGGYLPSLLDVRARDVFLTRFTDRGAAGKQLESVPLYFLPDEYNTLIGLTSMVDTFERGHVNGDAAS